MTDPASGDGGGDAAASALAFRLVSDATFDADLASRVRQCIGEDSETDAAAKLGEPESMVGSACREGRASARLLCHLCFVYGVDGHWLLTGSGGPSRNLAPPEPLPAGERPATMSQLIRMLKGAPGGGAPNHPDGANAPDTTNPQGQEYL